MKLKYFSFLATTCLLALGSCTTIRQSTVNAEQVETSVSSYTVADLDVQNKVKKTESWSYRPFNIGEGTLSNRKENLAAAVVREANADVLLEPQFEYTKESFGARTLTVTGYPATYKNFRKATPEDIEALKTVKPVKEQKVVAISASWFKNITNKIKSFFK